MPRLDNSLPVFLHQQICNFDPSTCAGCKTVADFKRTISCVPDDLIRESMIILKTNDDRDILLKDEETFDSHLENIKEIDLFSNQTCAAPPPVAKKKFTSFTVGLSSEKLDLPIVDKTACLLVTCFGDFWESVFHQLDDTYTNEFISLELEDSGKNVYRAATRLLMKWAHKMGNGGTHRALLDKLDFVHKCGATNIDWGKIERILFEGT